MKADIADYRNRLAVALMMDSDEDLRQMLDLICGSYIRERIAEQLPRNRKAKKTDLYTAEDFKPTGNPF